MTRTPPTRKHPALPLLAASVVGLSLSATLAVHFLGLDAYAPSGRLFVLAVPAASFAFLLYQVITRGGWLGDALPGLASWIAAVLAVVAGVTVCLGIAPQTPGNTAAGFIAVTAAAWFLVSPAIRCLGYLLMAREHLRLAVAWLAGTIASFLAVGFLSKYYRSALEILALTVALQLMLGLVAFHALGRLRRLARRSAADAWISLFLLLLPSAGTCALFWIGSDYPAVFRAGLLLPDASSTAVFIVGGLLSLPWLAWAVHETRGSAWIRRLRPRTIARFVEGNLPGLLLAAQFLLLYFAVGSVLNQERFDVDDIFFDADAFIWRYRLTTEHWQDFYWRSVHPLALLILRPAVVALAILLRGDRAMAASVLAAAVGAMGVFLAWLFARNTTKKAPPALMIAALFGLSASQLVFGSMIETYALLAAASLLFLVLLQRGTPMRVLVPVGLLSAGVTLTHLGQSALAMLAVRPDPRLLVRYVLLVIAFLIPLSLVSELIYPNAAPLFFLTSGYSAEQENIWPLTSERLRALTRSLAGYAMVAPEPIVSRDVIPFSQFRFFRAESHELSEYETPLQSATSWSWAVLVVLGALSFGRAVRREDLRMSLALLLCLAFNALLLLRYGKEFFLYSANWTFALVLLLVLAWQQLLKRRWFQVALLTFLALLMLNDLALLRTIMGESAPYFS